MDVRRFRAARPALTPLVVAVGVLATLAATTLSWHAAHRAAEREQRAQADVLAARLGAATADATARLDDLAVAVDAARRPARGGFDPLAG